MLSKYLRPTRFDFRGTGIPVSRLLDPDAVSFARFDFAAVFVVFVDNAERLPAPPSSRIIEIKLGTCGDY